MSFSQGLPGGGVGGLRANGFDPVLHNQGDELRTVVGTNMARHTAEDEEIGEHVDRLQLAGNPDGEALAGELIHDVDGPELAAVMRTILDEVVGPHVIAVLGPEPDARAVVEPRAATLRLLGRHLQPLAPPDPLILSLSKDRRALRSRSTRHRATGP